MEPRHDHEAALQVRKCRGVEDAWGEGWEGRQMFSPVLGKADPCTVCCCSLQELDAKLADVASGEAPLAAGQPSYCV